MVVVGGGGAREHDAGRAGGSAGVMLCASQLMRPPPDHPNPPPHPSPPHQMDEIWVTWVPPDVAVGRLVERNGLAPDAAAARLQAQMPLPARLAAAGVAVCTAAPKETTRQALRGEWERLLARLRGGARGGAGDSPG